MEITCNHQAGTSCTNNKLKIRTFWRDYAWQFCTNNLPNAHNALVVYTKYVSAKAFIFLFIYTHPNQSQFGQLGGRKSDWLMMDGWTYNWNRGSIWSTTAAKPASMIKCIPISTISAEVIIRLANQYVPKTNIETGIYVGCKLQISNMVISRTCLNKSMV